MGIEFFLLVLLAGLGVLAFLFFSGSFGVAKAGSDQASDGERPTHAYVEEDSEARFVGADTKDEVRRRAEEDPNTEVR
ncbi:MAG TPA: hypothetical protein VGV10_04685 [Thermoleophilaceae bacterium]|nr:hypothetical protein [Thermoleophilaceae bacterium]